MRIYRDYQDYQDRNIRLSDERYEHIEFDHPEMICDYGIFY